MATATKSNQKKSKSSVEFKLELVALTLLVTGLVMGLSTVSYHSSDASFFRASARSVTQNWLGYFGATISEVLLQAFGLAAFLLPPMLFFIAFSIKDISTRLGLKKFVLRLCSSATLKILLTAVSVGLLLQVFIPSLVFGGREMRLFGLMGAVATKSIQAVIGIWGQALFSIFSLLALSVVHFRWSPVRLLRVVVNQLLKTGQSIGRGVWGAGFESLRVQRVFEDQLQKKFQSSQSREEKIRSDIGATSEAAQIIERSVAPKLLAPRRSTLTQDNAKKSSSDKSPVVAGSATLPSLDFLEDAPAHAIAIDKQKLFENSKILENKLRDFGIDGEITAVMPGPVITMYEFRPGSGVKIAQIAALGDDLSLALSAQSVRIVAPIPGKSVVGIEIPNAERETVYLKEVLKTNAFVENHEGIPIALGKDISGEPIVSDIARMPHLLVAGASGKGKSVFINSLIVSLLYKFTPQELRLILVDPKQVELNLYDNIPHLLLPVVDDPKQAANALKWTCNEMERRYKMLAKCGVRNIQGFNQKLDKEGSEALQKLLNKEDENISSNTNIEKLPMILVVIDEFADLMMTAPKDIETSVARLGQKARAAGIHVVIATQRPSVDVITGLIKANLPSRVSFQVASKIDSRTILDGMGAEKLLGMGDMLFIPPGSSRVVRVHGAFVQESEIVKICDHWRAQGTPDYRNEILTDTSDDALRGGDDDDSDVLYDEAVATVRSMGHASASMLQRRFKIGYNRASRLVDMMEREKIIGPSDGAKARIVL